MKPIRIIICKYDKKFVNNVLEIIKRSENCQIDIIKHKGSVVEEEIEKKDCVSIYTTEEFLKIFHAVDTNVDFIIMDADISVGFGWVEKMYQCAYRSGDIATVSPMFSVKENEQTVCEINNDLYLEIDKPYGRCLYIKGKVLFELRKNIFDMESDKDFILKKYYDYITQLGYIHILTGNVLCYLSTIDEDEKNKNIGFILPELYHELWKENFKKNLLFYSFADFKENSSNNIGGTQLHLKDLVSQLKCNYNVIVAARDRQYLQITRYAEEEYCFRFYIGEPCSEMKFYSEETRKLLIQIIRAFHIDIIHVQHLLGMTHDIFDIAEEMHIPIIITIHDFYYICPLWRLIQSNKEICTSSMDMRICASCLKQYRKYDKNINYILRWRNEYRTIVQRCTKIVFPSISARDVFCSFYPEAKDKDVIIEHGINKTLFHKAGVCNNDINQIIRIAFIGGISEIKGGELIYNMIRESNSDIEWHLIGGNSYQPLINLKRGNVKSEGWYNREDLHKILSERKIDIICILSIVPETYCYALSEAIACGIPVISSDIGALGRRVKEMQCGWLIAPNSTSEDILALIQNIRNNPDLYYSIWHQVQKIEIKGIEEMAKEYGNIYNLYNKRNNYESFDVFEIIQGKNEEKYSSILSKNNDLDVIKKLLEEREVIINSQFYKVWNKLCAVYDAIRWRILKKDR